MKKIRDINFFDPNIFMYYDDLDLCRRVKKSKNKIYLVKNSIASHLCGKSSNSHGYDLRRHFHFGWSTSYYYKKYYKKFFSYLLIYLFIYKSYLKYLMNILLKKKSEDIIKSIEGTKMGMIEKKDYERSCY